MLVRNGAKTIVRSNSSNMSSAARSVAPALSNEEPSHWEVIPMGPPDPIMGLTESFKKDANERKVRTYVYG